MTSEMKKDVTANVMKVAGKSSQKKTKIISLPVSPFLGLYCFMIFCCLGMSLLVPASAQESAVEATAADEVETDDTTTTATTTTLNHEISYILEPYEDTITTSSALLFDIGQGDVQADGLFDLSLNGDDALFGNYSLQVNYHNDYVAVGGDGDSDKTARFGWLTSEAHRRYSCAGATHMSFWYKMLPSSSTEENGGSNMDFNLRFVLLDSSDVDCVSNVDCTSNPDLFEHYYSSNLGLQSPDDVSSSDWKEVRIPLDGDNFMLGMNNGRGQNGNEVLDLHSLKGWYYELSPGADPPATATDAESITAVLIDQLACVGGEELFGSSFHIGIDETFDKAVSYDLWYPEYYQSDLSQTETRTTLQGGVLSANYTIEQSETWGGFVSYQHIATDQSYFNLSQASSVSLNYEVSQGASPSSRAHLRILLQDSSGCTEGCGIVGANNLEVYYSFHNILDEIGSGIMKVPLVGTSDASSPFWRTGWSGVVGNDVLDSATIKGFTLELNADSQGEVGSLVQGAIKLSNLSAVLPNAGADDPSFSVADGTCIDDPGVYVPETSSELRRIEFLANQCCELCEAEEDCIYAITSDGDCFLAPHIQPESISIVNIRLRQERYRLMRQDSGTKRGDFCQVCDCRESDRTIDCRGRDLAILPMTFSPPTDMPLWSPRVLDLYDNPRLVLIGPGSLKSVAESLEELRLPENLQFMAHYNFNDLLSLTTVSFEREHRNGQVNSVGTGSVSTSVSSGDHDIQNVITEPTGFFSDVCCGLGEQVVLTYPSGGLTFCDMTVDTPGADAEYEPFIEYFEADSVETLRPSSYFMSEAAESPEKCAEYCAIRDGCWYFSYDARRKEAEHTCYLQINNGTSSEVCCHPDDYADDKATIPGWTSGRPPRTRHIQDNARVLSVPNELTLNEDNNYRTQFQVSLGSTPLRGAVWVEPVFATATLYDSAAISPPRIAFYDDKMVQSVTVELFDKEISTSETIVVTLNIESCDAAFTTTDTLLAESTIYIEVEPNQLGWLRPAVIIPVVLIVVLIAVFLYVDHNKRKADALFKVNPSELHFSEPPEIIGRGTFGLVLLAEYRGTLVAVKRVIPPRLVEKRKKSQAKKNRFANEEQEKAAGEMDLETGSQVSSRSSRSINVNGMSLQLGSGSAMHSSGSRFTSLLFGDDYARLKKDFVSEMRYLSKLRHPCITTVMGAVISTQDEPMLVMEYMDHGSLFDILHNETMILEGEQILPILRDIAQGIRFLHSADPQVIHGDLKAQNILVDNRFRAKVADFGLSQKRRLGATGTPQWMAPELLRGECTNTAASDVYSFGIILYEVYSRREPYEGEDLQNALRLVADKSVQKRPEIPSEWPPEMANLTKSCLIDDSNERPNAQDVDLYLKELDVTTVEPCQQPLHSHHLKKENHVQSEALLFEVFPKHVAEALRAGRKVEPEQREMVTIFFSDIVGFTDISAMLPPMKVSDLLDRLYHKFDELSIQHDLFKVETIGDAYMAVSNLIKDQPDHASKIAQFSIDAQKAANETLIDIDNPERGHVDIRVGFHSGPVVANVVGSRNPRYCLFGDTVNTASRMESHSEANRIHCSERSAQLLHRQDPKMKLKSRGLVNVKGKGEMATYWVNEGSTNFRPRLVKSGPSFKN